MDENIAGLHITADGSDIAVTSSVPVAVPIDTGLQQPFTNAECVGQGINATSNATLQPYTGVSLHVQNKGTAAVTISIYVESLTSGGQVVRRTYNLPSVAANGAETQSLVWGDAADSCTPGSGAFDQTKLLGIGFVVTSASAANLNLALSDITYTGAGVATPCTGICSNPVVTTTKGGSVGTAEYCVEYMSTTALDSGNCGNFAAGRTFSINGAAATCNWVNFKLPAPKNGGYCFSAPAGANPNNASYGFW
ncbi:MAG: hypothetical protein QM767_25975 [Anaeromyxobacter sp.]